MAKKWVKKLSNVGGLQELKTLSTGRAKVGQAENAVNPSKWAEAKRKAKAARRGLANMATKRAGFEEFAECTWIGKTVRVSKEGDNEGRVGRVTSALKRGDEYKLCVASGEGAAATIFHVDADGVELERPNWAEPAPDKLDYRCMRVERRAALAQD